MMKRQRSATTIFWVLALAAAVAVVQINAAVKRAAAEKAHQHRFDHLEQSIDRCLAEDGSAAISACKLHCSTGWTEMIDGNVCAELQREGAHL